MSAIYTLVSRAELIAKAKAANRPIGVLRTTTVVPIRQGGTVRLQPAVHISYWLDVYVADRVDCWRFEETLQPDRDSVVWMRGTLLDELERKGVRHYFKHRSGSF